MQVQTQNDKMVPIDTSGDPVEVELKEEEKKEQQTTEPEVQVEEAPVEEKVFDLEVDLGGEDPPDEVRLTPTPPDLASKRLGRIPCEALYWILKAKVGPKWWLEEWEVVIGCCRVFFKLQSKAVELCELLKESE